MRWIKLFIVGVTGLFIVVTLLSLLIPSKVMVSRGVVINASAKKVFDEIANLENWKHWHPVISTDTTTITFNPGDKATEPSLAWQKNGTWNKILLKSIAENQITALLTRRGENDVTNVISVLPLSDSSSVQVEWRSVVKLKWYPWEKFYGIFIEKLSGPGHEAALKGLKDYVENGPVTPEN